MVSACSCVCVTELYAVCTRVCVLFGVLCGVCDGVHVVLYRCGRVLWVWLGCVLGLVLSSQTTSVKGSREMPICICVACAEHEGGSHSYI